MNGLSNTSDEVVECPLCMEPLEVDDLNFYPCTCGYQICRFCWHRIRTDENELCPACRKEYPENPADFTPLTQEEMIAFKSQKRQRDQQRKQKITENRKHLSNVRVVQKNLVFVVGLPPRLADADILKKHEYFGKYGKIHKVVINPSTTYAGVQGPSASAYVTYVHNSDALRAIQSVNNIMIDGRLIKTSLGTTKYCSHFMKNQQCPKGDCMYLHELGDPEASFTKEEMHQGKHQEYEKRLHDALIANSGTSPICGGMGQATSSVSNAICSGAASSKGLDGKSVTGSALATSSSVSSAMSASSVMSSASSSSSAPAVNVAGVANSAQQKDAWPSLSVSPVNSKEVTMGSSTNAKNKREKSKYDKSKTEKNKPKSKNNSNHSFNNNCSNATNKENQPHTTSNSAAKETTVEQTVSDSAVGTAELNNNNSSCKSRAEKSKEKSLTNRNNSQLHQQQAKERCALSADEEVKLIEDSEKRHNKGSTSSSSRIGVSSSTPGNDHGTAASSFKDGDEQRSLSSSSNSSNMSSGSSSTANNSDILSISESVSGKSSPNGFTGPTVTTMNDISQSDTLSLVANSDAQGNDEVTTTSVEPESNRDSNSDLPLTSSGVEDDLLQQLPNDDSSNIMNTTATLSKLNLFDDNNSFFSASLQHTLLLKNKLGPEIRQNQINNTVTSHLPDLLNGIDGYQNSPNSSEWGEVFKSAMVRNNKQLEDQLQHQQIHQQQHLHHQQQLQQDEFLRMQEMQKRSSLLNNMGMTQMNGPHSDFGNISNNFHSSTDVSRLSQATLMQQQFLQHQQSASQHTDHLISNSLFGTNMSKFFDFHKNQQQQLQQQFLMNGSSGSSPLGDHLRMSSLLDNNRITSQFRDQTNGLLSPQQQTQIQKQRLLGKFDPLLSQQQHSQSQQQQQGSQLQQQSNQQNRLSNQFSQNTSVDDDLGFDPFIETQKGLAELMENEVVQQQNTSAGNGVVTTTPSCGVKMSHQQQITQQHQQQMLDNMQRARMPPPGFNHMNAFGFGVPRAQNTTSKILPFMNMTGSASSSGGQSSQQQQQMSMAPSSWNPHLAFQQQQQQQSASLTDSQMHQINPNSGSLSKGHSNNDWTAMDPAILSFRQFSSFPQQPQMQSHHAQPQQQDLFMQHLTQQQQQGNNQGFGLQPPQLHSGGLNLGTGLLNTQSNSQAQQANFSHANWLSTEQSLFMNSLANGFNNNNFDKFPIPMPPGIHQNTMNLNKQQKAECIN